MGDAMTAVVFGVGALYALWLFYLAVMNLKRAKDAGTLSRLALVCGYPILLTGLVLDLIVNVFVASIVFLDLPSELTVTARLKRYVKESPESWRGLGAKWFSEKLLDTFDPSGRHV
jgi:hypothetical protein